MTEGGAHPKVTILLTVYRRLEYLRSALESALNQDHPNFEVLLLDDSGEQMAEEFCRSYIEKRQIRYLPSPSNIGIVASLREGIQAARGQFIAILNDDDVLEHSFLTRLSSVLEERPSCNLVFSDHYIIDAKGIINIESTSRNSELYGRSNLPEGPVGDAVNFAVVKNGVPLAMAAIFRRDSLKFADILVQEVAGAYDYWISANLAVSGEIYYVPQRLSRYRIHSAMETARLSPDKNANLIYINRELLRRQEYSLVHPILRRRLSAAYSLVGRDCLLFGRRREAMRNFYASIETKWNIKAIVGILACGLPTAWTHIALKASGRGA